MKKLILTLFIGLLSLSVFGQRTNKLIQATKGVEIGDPKSNTIFHCDSASIFNGKVYLFHEGDTIPLGTLTSETIDLSTVFKPMTDTTGFFIFGKGVGDAADSVGFAKNSGGFGAFIQKSDTLVATSFNNLRFSAGDSLVGNFYVGNSFTGVAVDSMFTNPQGFGHHATSIIPTKRVKIAPGESVWPGLKSNQVTGKRPKEWLIQLNGYIIPK